MVLISRSGFSGIKPPSLQSFHYSTFSSFPSELSQKKSGPESKVNHFRRFSKKLAFVPRDAPYCHRTPDSWLIWQDVWRRQQEPVRDAAARPCDEHSAAAAALNWKGEVEKGGVVVCQHICTLTANLRLAHLIVSNHHMCLERPNTRVWCIIYRKPKTAEVRGQLGVWFWGGGLSLLVFQNWLLLHCCNTTALSSLKHSAS